MALGRYHDSTEIHDAGVTTPCIMKVSTVRIIGSVIYHMNYVDLPLISKVGLPL